LAPPGGASAFGSRELLAKSKSDSLQPSAGWHALAITVKSNRSFSFLCFMFY